MSGLPAANASARREERVRQATPAELILLRHGEPDWTPGGGRSVEDAALTERGRLQAEAAAQALAARDFDAIYVSPLRRAQETAAPLAAATGLTPVTVDGLAEISVALRGLTQTEVEAYFTRAAQRRLRDLWDGWPGGEDFRDFHARVTTALEALLATHGMPARTEDDFTVWRVPERHQRIAVVAHGGTNAVALTHLLDVRAVPWEWNRFEYELAAYAVVQARPLGVEGFTWSLGRFNEAGHLSAAGL